MGILRCRSGGVMLSIGVTFRYRARFTVPRNTLTP
nr:MAG TPA: hypothetical protein [Caudoviricetes sp.]